MAAAADVRLGWSTVDRDGRIDEVAGLQVATRGVAVADPDLAGEDQRLRPGAGLGQAALDEQLVQPEASGSGGGLVHGRIVAQAAHPARTGRPGTGDVVIRRCPGPDRRRCPRRRPAGQPAVMRTPIVLPALAAGLTVLVGVAAIGFALLMAALGLSGIGRLDLPGVGPVIGIVVVAASAYGLAAIGAASGLLQGAAWAAVGAGVVHAIGALAAVVVLATAGPSLPVAIGLGLTLGGLLAVRGPRRRHHPRDPAAPDLKGARAASRRPSVAPRPAGA